MMAIHGGRAAMAMPGRLAWAPGDLVTSNRLVLVIGVAVLVVGVVVAYLVIGRSARHERAPERAADRPDGEASLGNRRSPSVRNGRIASYAEAAPAPPGAGAGS